MEIRDWVEKEIYKILYEEMRLIALADEPEELSHRVAKYSDSIVEVLQFSKQQLPELDNEDI